MLFRSTSSPSGKLNVAGGVDSVIRNTASSGSSWFVGTNTSSYILHNESATPMLFTTSGTERMRIDSSGRVTMPYQPAFRARRTIGTFSGAGVIRFDTADVNLSASNSSTISSNILLKYAIDFILVL